jgi:ABC-2 type transport system permease protein
LLVGTFDFVFAVVAIFPLFILGLTHDLVSSERERGTLTPLLTAPISFDRILIAGRLARAEVTVAAAVSLASGAIALACAAPSEGTTSPPEGIRRLDAA